MTTSYCGLYNVHSDRMRGLGVNIGGWICGLGLGLCPFACAPDMFECSTDEQCVQGSNAGVCQATGWCSFEDLDCPSQQRYGEHVGSDLAGVCVPVADDGSSGPTEPAEPNPPSASSSAGDGGTEDTTGNPVDSGVSDETSSTSGGPGFDSTDTGEVGSEVGSEGGSSGMVDPPCMTVIADDFADGMIDPQWHSWEDPGTALEEFGSALHLTVVGNVLAHTHTGINSMDLFDMNEGILRIEVAEPPVIAGARLYWQLVVDGCGLGAFIQGDLVESQGVGAMYDPSLRWLQLRVTGGIAHVEGSLDGVAWQPLLPPMPSPCDLTDARVLLFGGAVIDSGPGPASAVAGLEACSVPPP